jgi:hypothetical protein
MILASAATCADLPGRGLALPPTLHARVVHGLDALAGARRHPMRGGVVLRFGLGYGLKEVEL